MAKENAIKLFQNQRVREHWNNEQEKWYFSIVDVGSVLTASEQLLRLIQSIIEPFKLWLAKVGYERIEETEDPEKAFERAMGIYLKKGYSVNWINQRLKSIEFRKELTDKWNVKGVTKGIEYAILTDEITKAWSGIQRFQGFEKRKFVR